MKFRWFRQRLNIEETNNYDVAADLSGETDDSSAVISQGVYRQSAVDDFDEGVVLRRHEINSSQNQTKTSSSK